MVILFNLRGVFGLPRKDVRDARVLRVLLDALTNINRVYLETADHPVSPLYRAGVVYAPEPAGEEVWQPIPAMYELGVGDCEDLAAARVAELRHAGHYARAVFRWMPHANGSRGYHILVDRGPKWTDGHGSHYEDPSRILGMGKNRTPVSQMPDLPWCNR